MHRVSKRPNAEMTLNKSHDGCAGFHFLISGRILQTVAAHIPAMHVFMSIQAGLPTKHHMEWTCNIPQTPAPRFQRVGVCLTVQGRTKGYAFLSFVSVPI